MWSYYQLHFMIEYKAKAAGIRVEYIDQYTSQTCLLVIILPNQIVMVCLFMCKCCGYRLHSDLIKRTSNCEHVISGISWNRRA